MNIKLAIAVSGIVLGALASPVLADKPDSEGAHGTHGNAGGNDNSEKGNGKANNPGSETE
jgi:hypothetical protein